MERLTELNEACGRYITKPHVFTEEAIQRLAKYENIGTVEDFAMLQFSIEDKHDKEIRAKAINEFAEALKRRYPIVGSVNRWLNENIDEIAKKLKGETV